MTELKTVDGRPVQVMPRADNPDDSFLIDGCDIWFGLAGDPAAHKVSIDPRAGAALVREVSYNCGIPVQELMEFSIGDSFTFWELDQESHVTWTRGGDDVWRPDHPDAQPMTDRDVAQQQLHILREQAGDWSDCPQPLRALSRNLARQLRLQDYSAPDTILDSDRQRLRVRIYEARRYLDELAQIYGEEPPSAE